MASLQRRDSEWIPSAPILVSRSQPIDASADQVWSIIADHERWPEWFTTLKSVEVTGAAAGVGGTRRVRIPGAALDEVFTAWSPGEQFAFSVLSGFPGLIAMAESVDIETVDAQRCVVRYSQGIEPRRGFGWLWKLIAKRAGKTLEAALGSLATVAER